MERQKKKNLLSQFLNIHVFNFYWDKYTFPFCWPFVSSMMLLFSGAKSLFYYWLAKGLFIWRISNLYYVLFFHELLHLPFHLVCWAKNLLIPMKEKRSSLSFMYSAFGVMHKMSSLPQLYANSHPCSLLECYNFVFYV